MFTFGQAASLKRELNSLPDLTDGLDDHGIRLTLQDVEQLSNSPPAFVTVAKLGGLTTAERAHSRPPNCELLFSSVCPSSGSLVHVMPRPWLASPASTPDCS